MSVKKILNNVVGNLEEKLDKINVCDDCMLDCCDDCAVGDEVRDIQEAIDLIQEVIVEKFDRKNYKKC